MISKFQTRLLCVSFIFFARHLFSAVLIGNGLVGTTGNGLYGPVSLIPQSNPLILSNGNLAFGVPYTIGLTNGGFTNSVVAGNYTLRQGSYTVSLSVPDTTNTLYLTNLLTGGFSSNYIYNAASAVYGTKVDGNDTSAGFLLSKLLNTPGITWTVTNSSGREQIVLTDSGSGFNGLVLTNWVVALSTNSTNFAQNVVGLNATNFAAGVSNAVTNLAAFGNVSGTIGNGRLNVRDFGASGNGTTDDTAALQFVFNLVYSNGGNCGVYMPPGVYRTSATLMFPGGNTQLFSDGQGAIIRCYTPNITSLNCGLAGFPFTNGNQITVRNIVIDNTQGARNCLEFCGVTNGLIDNCYFLNPGLNNIQSGVPRGYGCWLVRLDNSSSGPSAPCVNVTVQNCTLYGCCDAGYEASGAINCAFIGNHGYNCYSGQSLLAWNGSQGCRFIGNDIWASPGNTNWGIVVDEVSTSLTATYQTNFQTTGNIFIGNYINGSTNGIYLTNPYQVSNNIFMGNILANCAVGLDNFATTNLNIFLNNVVTGTNPGTYVQDTYPLDWHTNNFLGYAGNNTNTSVWNTGFGFNALSSLSSGGSNTAQGAFSFPKTTTGGFNTGQGYFSGDGNTTGNDNTFIGFGAGSANSTGADNTAVGYDALDDITTSQNTALGSFSQRNMSSGGFNLSAGYNSLESDSSGSENTVIGYDSALKNIGGSYITAAGALSLEFSQGSSNIAVGFEALQLLTNGYNNVMVGNGAGITNGSTNIYLGNPGANNDTNIIRIGTTQSAAYLAGTWFPTNGIGSFGTNFTSSIMAQFWTNTNAFNVTVDFISGVTNLCVSNSAPLLIFRNLTNSAGYSRVIGPGYVITNSSAAFTVSQF